MKRRQVPQNPPFPGDLTDGQVNKLLRYELFKSVCRIVEAGTTDRKRFHEQRAALEKKLGYDSLKSKA
jgi:hypothetical protein